NGIYFNLKSAVSLGGGKGYRIMLALQQPSGKQAKQRGTKNQYGSESKGQGSRFSSGHTQKPCRSAVKLLKRMQKTLCEMPEKLSRFFAVVTVPDKANRSN